MQRITKSLIRSFGARASSKLITPATKLTTLSNGLRVASEESYGQIATVGVWIDTGSRNETAANNGVAHFLEHMHFKGTPTRSQTQLETELENMGGSLNAFTSREHTVFVAKVFKDDVPKAVDILSDILQKSNYSADAIDREKSTILREAEDVATQMDEVVFDLLHETAYQGTSLGRTILGPNENISKFTRENLVDYVSTHYTAPRMLVVGAGAVKHDDLCKLAQTQFADLPQTPKNGGLAVPLEPAVYTGSQILKHDDDQSAAHVCLAIEGVGWANADTIPFLVMQNILGSWDRQSGIGRNVSSQLCQQIAEGEYAHKLNTFMVVYKDTSLFGNYFVTDPDNIDNAVNTIQNQWMRLCFAPTVEEVNRAKNSLKAQVLLLDGSQAAFEDIGRQIMVYGRRLPITEVIARIDAVNVDTIKRVASTYIYDQEPVCAAVGKGVENVPDLNWLRGGNTWWRV